MGLVAKRAILYQNTYYTAGDLLPCNNLTMVNAWIESGSAEFSDENQKVAPVQPVKAKLATAEPGQTGKATGSDSDGCEDLVGKVPKTQARTTGASKSRAKKKEG